METIKSPESSENFELNARTKSSLKIHYDAQAIVIERQLGGLEGVRAQLGLSQRKMAQLLMVDPSAWTRWNRSESRAPALVWRALQWYMILQEKIPGLNSSYFLGSAPSAVQGEALKEIRRETEAREALEEKIHEMNSNLGQFREENQRLLSRLAEVEKRFQLWRVGTMILTVTLIFSVLIWILWVRRGFF